MASSCKHVCTRARTRANTRIIPEHEVLEMVMQAGSDNEDLFSELEDFDDDDSFVPFGEEKRRVVVA